MFDFLMSHLNDKRVLVMTNKVTKRVCMNI